MGILELDLHIGKDPTENLKIVQQLKRHDEVSTIRLFSSDFSYKSLVPYQGIVLSGLDKSRLLNCGKMEILKGYLKKLADNGTYILGICGGHQILATAYGYSVERISRQVGWPVVNLTDLGKSDSLFRGLGPTIRPFQYHDKTVTGVEESKVLARDDIGIQAARFAKCVYGVQFHPEDSPEGGLEFLEKNGMAESKLLVPETHEEKIIFKNFVDMTTQNQR
jgi:GMP synthase-like glutamine amidotransferase